MLILIGESIDLWHFGEYNIFKVAPLKGETGMKALMLEYPSKSSIDNSYQLYDIYSVLFESQEFYPEIFKWYFKMFMPGLVGGRRHIIRYDIGSDVAGIALIKKEENEKKICTLRVRSKYRSNGIGKKLFKKCMEILDTEKPMITASAERLHYFLNIFKYYNLKLEQVIKGYYRENSSEFVFNGYLNLKEKSCNNGSKESREDKCIHFNEFLSKYCKIINNGV
jgi:ribosomal protein S18 acetylase RimI-like enzyme